MSWILPVDGTINVLDLLVFYTTSKITYERFIFDDFCAAILEYEHELKSELMIF